MSSKSFFTYGISAIVFVLLVIGLYQIGFGPHNEVADLETPMVPTTTKEEAPALSLAEQGIANLVIKSLGSTGTTQNATQYGFKIIRDKVVFSTPAAREGQLDIFDAVITQIKFAGWDKNVNVGISTPTRLERGFSSAAGIIKIYYEETPTLDGKTFAEMGAEFVRTQDIANSGILK